MSAFDTKAFLQELKTNRRTQGALVGFAAVFVWMVWSLGSDTPKARPRRVSGSDAPAIDPKAISNLERLPHLAQLNRAGELPPIPKLVRDPFLFDVPKPEPARATVPDMPPPAPEPTEAEKEEMRKKAIRDQAFASRPQDLRYIGFLEGRPTGQIGAFMKGEEALPIPLGAIRNQQWKLVALTEKMATFQHLAYPDLRLDLATREAAASSAQVNEY